MGIPYPLVVDPKTIMKKYYLDNKSYNAHKLSGQQWYCQQATRALNQAIGRVIRHKEDYGNIVLIDQRFDSDKQMKEISSWIRDQVEVYEDSNDAIERFAMFYKEMKSRGFKKKVE